MHFFLPLLNTICSTIKPIFEIVFIFKILHFKAIWCVFLLSDDGEKRDQADGANQSDQEESDDGLGKWLRRNHL